MESVSSNGGGQEAAGVTLDDLEASYDVRVDQIRDMAVTLANILREPSISSALKRNETRQVAHAALLATINAMASMCESSAMYADALAQFHVAYDKDKEAPEKK